MVEQTQILDIHAHAMPLPLLRWLADQGLADTSAVEQEIIRIDPQISGVGPNVCHCRWLVHSIMSPPASAK